ncbi:MAG TPA: hypothetical protein VFC46_12675 [Humisphaera sp.]|nr:hypothetical protein [Humisphaera sp.]
MPVAVKSISKGRVEFGGSLTSEEIDSLISDPHLEILQTSSPVDTETWKALNDRLFSLRHDVDLRVYGFYSSECDLSFLKRLPNLRRFSADCLMRAKGIDCLGALENLESLSVGIYNLETFDFLNSLPNRKLKELILGPTKSRKPTLRDVMRFNDLRKLHIDGQQKDIEVISTLQYIEDLTLRSVSVDGLNFLKGLHHLWSLDIKLGGTSDLSALEGMNRIKYLELWQIRNLKDVSVIATMRGLQYLFLQSLPHIHAVPDLSKLRELRKVHLENLKGLQDLSALAKAPVLEEFIHVSAAGMEPAQYTGVLTSKTLKRILVGFGSERKNKALRELATQAGIEQLERSQFSFT